MDNDAVWLYSVIDHKNLSIEELQSILNTWSDDHTPHELLICGDKMIMKFQSGLVRMLISHKEEQAWNSERRRKKE